jgi:hypothetical protein
MSLSHCQLTTAVTGVAAIDLFGEKRWTATPVHRIVRQLSGSDRRHRTELTICV